MNEESERWLAVRGRIRQAQAAVERAGTLVRQVRERLSGRAEEVRRRLTAIAAERADLLTRR